MFACYLELSYLSTALCKRKTGTLKSNKTELTNFYETTNCLLPANRAQLQLHFILHFHFEITILE